MMRSSSKSIATFTLASAIALSSGCGAAPDQEPPESLGSVQVELTQVPTGVACIGISVAATGVATSEQRFTVTSGQASTLTVTALPFGPTTLSGKAYAAACSSVTSTTIPLWLSDPVSTVLTPGQVASVPLALRAQPSATVAVDFCTAPPCSTSVLATSGDPISDIVATNNRVYFHNPTGLFSVPALGGAVTGFADTESPLPLGDGLAADGTSLYWTRTAITGAQQIMKAPLGGGTPTLLFQGAVTGNALMSGNTLFFVADGGNTVMGMPSGTTSPRAIATDSAGLRSVRPYLVDGASVYYISSTTLNVVSPTGGFASTLYAPAGGESVSAIGTDSKYVYFGSRGGAAPITLKRVPAGGGPAETFSADTGTWIVRVIVDGAAAYWTTLNQSASGNCTSSKVQRRIIGSATTELLYTINGACTSDLAVDNGAVYVSAGRQIVRIAK